MTKVTIKDVEARMDRLEGLLEKLIQAQTRVQVSEISSSKKDKKVKTSATITEKTAGRAKHKNGYAIITSDYEIPFNDPVKVGRSYYVGFNAYCKKDVFAIINNGTWDKEHKGFRFNTQAEAIEFIKKNRIITAKQRNAVISKW